MALGASADSQQQISKSKIVLVGHDPRILALDQALNRARCESQVVPRGEFALDLIAWIGQVDLVVVEHPLPDMELDGFLAGLRSGKARASSTPVVVLAARTEDFASLDDSQCRVYPLDWPVSEMVAVLTGRLERAQRAAAKLLVRLSLEKSGQAMLRLAQSENVSRTGMLLHTREDFPDDARTRFELSLPGEDRPVVGEARIVRKSNAGSDAFRAVGIRFESFRKSDLPRFEAFLADLLSTTSYREPP